MGFPGYTVVRNLPANAGDSGGMGSIPWSGNGNLLQYSCPENPMDRGAWWAVQSMGSQTAGHNWTHTHTLKLYNIYRSENLAIKTATFRILI